VGQCLFELLFLQRDGPGEVVGLADLPAVLLCGGTLHVGIRVLPGSGQVLGVHGNAAQVVVMDQLRILLHL
jgi:hypothetical protein